MKKTIQLVTSALVILMLVGIAVGYSYANTGFKAPWFANEDGSFNSSNVSASEKDPYWYANMTAGYAKGALGGIPSIAGDGDNIFYTTNTDTFPKVTFSQLNGYSFLRVITTNTGMYDLQQDRAPLYDEWKSILRNNTLLCSGANITCTYNADGSVTLSASGLGSGGVNSVTATSPLASSGGVNPNISLSGTVDIAHGGTGATSASAARMNLGVIGSGNVTATSPLTSSGGANPIISLEGPETAYLNISVLNVSLLQTSDFESIAYWSPWGHRSTIPAYVVTTPNDTNFDMHTNFGINRTIPAGKNLTYSTQLIVTDDYSVNNQDHIGQTIIQNARADRNVTGVGTGGDEWGQHIIVANNGFNASGIGLEIDLRNTHGDADPTGAGLPLWYGVAIYPNEPAQYNITRAFSFERNVGSGKGVYIGMLLQGVINEGVWLQGLPGGATNTAGIRTDAYIERPIVIEKAGAGIEMRSPDSTIYCVTVANGGALTSTAGSCS